MNQPNTGFAFEKKNYQLLLVGLVVVIIGYLLMSGGGSHDPNEFNEAELFSARRITAAPIIVLLGYLFIGYAIMYKPRHSGPGKSGK